MVYWITLHTYFVLEMVPGSHLSHQSWSLVRPSPSGSFQFIYTRENVSALALADPKSNYGISTQAFHVVFKFCYLHRLFTTVLSNKVFWRRNLMVLPFGSKIYIIRLKNYILCYAFIGALYCEWKVNTCFLLVVQ